MARRRDAPPSDPSKSAEPPREAGLETMGGRIAWARLRRQMTQQELSEAVGKSRTTIVQYERDKIEPPVGQVAVVARQLGVSPEFLAFGRQGMAGTVNAETEIISLPEITTGQAGEVETGGYGFPTTIAKQLGIEADKAKVYVLNHQASEFGYLAGDRVIVNSLNRFVPEHSVYLLRSSAGVEVARLVPKLAAGKGVIDLIGGNGQHYTLKPEDLTILGAVVGSIRGR